jgi:thiol-disulfide isomerase/thioredoxin
VTPRQIARTPTGLKVCGKCQKELPKSTDFFDRDQGKEDGFKNWCKACRSERRTLAEAQKAAEIMKTLDMSVVANLAEAKPGGSTVPHAAEIYQCAMALMGGVQGFAMHYVGNLMAAKPGSQTRERMLTGLVKLGTAVSDSNKVQMPTELMSDDEFEKEFQRREERLRVIPVEPTNAREAS